MLDKKLHEQIMSILNKYDGDTKVVVKCASREKGYNIGKCVKVCARLITELQAYIPDEFIKVA